MQFELLTDRFKGCTYAKTGNGPNIILLHGFAEDGHIWKNQIPELGKQFTVIVPDFPGSGNSPLLHEELSMTLLADFVNNILIQENIEKTILFGHSMGGYVTLAFAEKYPNSLLGFSLVHSSAFEDDDTKKENRRKSIKLIMNDGKEVFLKAMIPNLYSENSKLSKQHEINEHLTMAMCISSNTLQAYYNAMIKRPSRIQVLQHTKVPVQFVIGKEDNAIPYLQSLQQCAIPKISKVNILDNIGHTSMYESPGHLTTILNSFCKYVLKFN